MPRPEPGNVGRGRDGEMGWEAQRPHEGFGRQTEEFALYTQMTGILLFRELETLLKRAGHSLGHPDWAETAAGRELAEACGALRSGSALPLWLVGVLRQVLTLSGLAMSAKWAPVATAHWAYGECWACPMGPRC